MSEKKYWAWIADEAIAHSPTILMGCESPRGAAESYAGMIVEENEGEVTEGCVRVWEDGATIDDAILFDFSAEISSYEGEDAEEGEVECVLEVTERE